MIKKLIAAAMLSCFMSTASATSLFVEENGTAYSYTKNKEAHRTRALPYHLKGLIPKGNVYIPEGTAIKVVPAHAVNGGFLSVGDVVDFELLEDFLINDVVFAPRGTRVHAVVSDAKHSWGFGHAGELTLRAENLRLRNGMHMPCNFYFHQKNESLSDGGVAVLTGVVFGSFFHGGDVRIPEYETFTLSAAADTDLGITVEQLKNLSAPVSVSPTVAMIPYIDRIDCRKGYLPKTIEAGYADYFRSLPLDIVSAPVLDSALEETEYKAERRALPSKEILRAVADGTGAEYVVALALADVKSLHEDSAPIDPPEACASAKYRLYIPREDKMIEFQTAGYGTSTEIPGRFYHSGTLKFTTPFQSAVADALSRGNQIILETIDTDQWNQGINSTLLSMYTR